MALVALAILGPLAHPSDAYAKVHTHSNSQNRSQSYSDSVNVNTPPEDGGDGGSDNALLCFVFTVFDVLLILFCAARILGVGYYLVNGFIGCLKELKRLVVAWRDMPNGTSLLQRFRFLRFPSYKLTGLNGVARREGCDDMRVGDKE